MEIIKTPIEGLIEVKGSVFKDERGYFFENYNKDRFNDAGLPTNFVQDNFSRSTAGIVRGMHLQLPPHGQLKFVRALEGRVLDVVVDLRPGSPTYGTSHSLILDAKEFNALIVPAGFAHGFAVLEDAIFHYKCTEVYHPESETGVRWNDPDLAIDWMVKDPIISEKDKKLPTFKEFTEKYTTNIK